MFCSTSSPSLSILVFLTTLLSASQFVAAQSESGSSAAGSVVGIILVLVIVFGFYYLYRKRYEKERANAPLEHNAVPMLQLPPTIAPKPVPLPPVSLDYYILPNPEQAAYWQTVKHLPPDQIAAMTGGTTAGPTGGPQFMFPQGIATGSIPSGRMVATTTVGVPMMMPAMPVATSGGVMLMAGPTIAMPQVMVSGAIVETTTT